MAAVSAITLANISVVNPIQAQIRTFIAAVALSIGEALYINTSGKVDLCDGNAAGKYQFRGIALETVGAGQAVSVLQEGILYGFDLSNVAYDGLVYVGDTAGDLADAAGTKTIFVGRCVPLPDDDLTKALHVSVTLNEADVS
jgi:hypothetical protein